MKFMAFMTTAFVAMSVLGGTCGQQNLAHASESIVSEQDKLREATEFWRNRLKVDRTGWLRHLDTGDTTLDCKRICDQTAILAGHDAAVALCGSRDAKDPGRYYTYEKCANPSTAATTKAAAIERVDAEIASFAPILAEKVEVNNAHYDSVHAFDVFKDELKDQTKDSGWNMSHFDFVHASDVFKDEMKDQAKDSDLDMSHFDSVHAFDVFKDELKDRAKDSGWDISHFLDTNMNDVSEEDGVCINLKPFYCFTPFRYYQTLLAGQHLGLALDFVTAVNRGTNSCYWVNMAAPDFDDSAIPFCEANKNFPGCQQFFDRLAECAAKKDDL